MNDRQTSGRGGRRKGAGRPKGTGKLYAFRAAGRLSRYIDGHENKTEFIRDCINREYLREEKALADGIIPAVVLAENVKPFTLPFFETRLAAGFPIQLDNNESACEIEILKMLCPHPESSYLIRVSGNSMIDAGICSGDILIVDKSNRNPTEREVAVCELNGEYTVKRVSIKGGRGWLIPANPDYPKIEITPEDRFSVWGVVTYIIHKPRE